jgi:phosphate/phosphite/phosphonate ABC transporter binding protein
MQAGQTAVIHWKNRLDTKILVLAVALPLVGILAISSGVFFILRSAFVEVARERSGSTSEIINRSIERVMVNGRADITRAMVEDLRKMRGIEQLDVIDGEGKKAFTADAAATEGEAIETLKRKAAPFSVRRGDILVLYSPLLNGPECVECHPGGKDLLGATKVTVSLKDVLEKGSSLVKSAILWSLVGVALMGLLLWFLLRWLVTLPVRRIQRAAESLAEGDLTVDAGVTSRDEIGRLWGSLQESLRTLSGVVTRINAVSTRVSGVADTIEKESSEVIESTGIEAESFGSIAASMEELNASINEISAGLADLSSAAAEAHVASREMAASIARVATNTDELSGGVAETTSTTGEMSHTIRELNWGANQLSDVSKETFTAVQSMETFLKEVEKDAHASAEYSEKVTEEAESLGMKAVHRTISSMEQIDGAFKKASSFISSLGMRSKEIGEIVDVIDDITDQTGLLALNAAILAAQAGEHGRGFQVVASEIRKLAVETAESTVKIADLVKNVRAEVAGAVESMDAGVEKVEGGFDCARESGAALEKILASARVSTEKAVSIRSSSGQQTENLSGVREAMKRLDQMSTFLAQGTAEQKREADVISTSAEHILTAVTQIKTATGEQMTASSHIEQAMQRISDGSRQMANALKDEKEGSAHLMRSLGQVVDLPARTRSLAVRINQGLRGVLGDTDLLREEVQSFTVLDDDEKGVMRLGVVPLESPAEMYRRFSALASYLGDLLHKPVKLKVALDFAEAVSDLAEGRTQAAYLTPSTYVLAKERCGAVLLAKALRGGKPYQHAVIITKSGSGIESLKDLRGRSFVFGDPNSTSSHIVPRAMLQEAGITLDSLSLHEHLGHHDAVARAVLRGDYDAGAVMRSVASGNSGKGLVILATSPAIPEFNFCASPDLPERDRIILSRALQDLKVETVEGKKILGSLYEDYSGFMQAEDQDYAGIRKMMQDLEMIGT